MHAAKFFDSYANDFSAIYGNVNGPLDRVINTLFRRSMRLRYEKTLAGCVPVEGKTVLDVGCGPGHYSVALARMGAKHVYGIDFAPSMIELAKERAAVAGVIDRCRFGLMDFNALDHEPFDYVILMGFMDYVSKPEAVVDKALAMTNSKAFFSFPKAEGFLAWQRRLRYRNRCDLFMYREKDVRRLFQPTNGMLERISRDYFVTVHK